VHFRKETLDWTRTRFQSGETENWQMPPQRVQQSFSPIFTLRGTPARPPKPRGISPVLTFRQAQGTEKRLSFWGQKDTGCDKTGLKLDW